MHPLKKAFCRVYQTVFKIAIPILPYRSPRVCRSVAEIPEILAEKSITNVMIVTDGFLHLSGKLEPLKQVLKENNIACTVYDEVVPNPTVWNVEMARERYIENGCQALIGFGGGSAIDCAKAVLLPYVLEAYGDSITAKVRDIAEAMGLADTTPAGLIAHIRGMNQRMDIPEKLPGIQVSDIPKLARNADNEANPLYPVPRLMDAGELERFYYDVMEVSK